MKAKGVTGHPVGVGNCPKDHAPEGQFYVSNNAFSPPGHAWSWHPPPFKYFASNTWVEVIHMTPGWNDEAKAMWFFYARGSGMWYNLGKTIGFIDHDEGCKHFNVCT